MSLPDPGSMFQLARTTHARSAVQAALERLHVDLAADEEAEAQALRAARDKALAELPQAAMHLSSRILGGVDALAAITAESDPVAVRAALASWEAAQGWIAVVDRALRDRLRRADLNPIHNRKDI